MSTLVKAEELLLVPETMLAFIALLGFEPGFEEKEVSNAPPNLKLEEFKPLEMKLTEPFNPPNFNGNQFLEVSFHRAKEPKYLEEIKPSVPGLTGLLKDPPKMIEFCSEEQKIVETSPSKPPNKSSNSLLPGSYPKTFDIPFEFILSNFPPPKILLFPSPPDSTAEFN